MSSNLPLLLGSDLFTSYLSAWVLNPAAQTVLAWASGGTALAAGAVIIKRVSQFLSDRAEGLDNAAKEAELTLHQIRSEIRTLLAKREHPLLIVMDDIDRLSSDQMKALFQLVKGNMDFPNVVFLLLFQRDTVEQGLERGGFKGAEYLEKIIRFLLFAQALGVKAHNTREGSCPKFTLSASPPWTSCLGSRCVKAVYTKSSGRP